MTKAKAAISRKTKIAFVAAIFVGFASPSLAQYYGPYGSYGPVYGQYSTNAPYYFPPTGYFAAHGEFYTRYTIPQELTHWFERNPPYFNN